MNGLLEILDDLVVEHWVKILVGLVLFGAGRWWGRLRSRKEWKSKDFKRRVTVSLNSLEHDKLLIRTVLEKEAAEIFINDEAVAMLLEAARKTDEKDPIVHLPESDRWHILNAVLNEIAENFKAGLFARDMGLSVKVQRYLFCITREVAGGMKARKIRVMMVRPEILEAEEFDTSGVELEQPQHSTRLETLQAMREAWKHDPEDFMSLEIVVQD